MLKMRANKRKFCGGVAHSTLTHKFSLIRAQIQHIDRSQQSSNGKSGFIAPLSSAPEQGAINRAPTLWLEFPASNRLGVNRQTGCATSVMI